MLLAGHQRTKALDHNEFAAGRQMEALYPLTREVLDALNAHVAVLDGDGVVIAVNNRWRRFGRLNGAISDGVGDNYLDISARAANMGDRAAMRVQRRLRRLLDGELDSFTLAYPCARRTFRLRATVVGRAPVRILVAHEDITSLLDARRKLHSATTGLTDVRNQHAAQVGEAYEELGQRLAAIALATHAIERAGNTSASVNIIRIAVDEAKQELRMLRYLAQGEDDADAA
jgi:PAS domain-containing protein